MQWVDYWVILRMVGEWCRTCQSATHSPKENFDSWASDFRRISLPEHCELVESWEYVLAGHTILMSTYNTRIFLSSSLDNKTIYGLKCYCVHVRDIKRNVMGSERRGELTSGCVESSDKSCRVWWLYGLRHINFSRWKRLSQQEAEK